MRFIEVSSELTKIMQRSVDMFWIFSEERVLSLYRSLYRPARGRALCRNVDRKSRYEKSRWIAAAGRVRPTLPLSKAGRNEESIKKCIKNSSIHHGGCAFELNAIWESKAPRITPAETEQLVARAFSSSGSHPKSLKQVKAEVASHSHHSHRPEPHIGVYLCQAFKQRCWRNINTKMSEKY